ncbi:hypothetical protein RND81_06G134100 [Saponaria officinalis]|uniref:Pentatricopeptide repeat-containing protein n=1 Tax=Saponaria officinalis TaxID=3572 RepID=A0AAW1KA42_SAPOF
MSLQNTLRNYNYIRKLSTNSSISSNSTLKSSSTWRIQAQQHQLISQISSILLQRHNWSSLLKTLNLSSKLTPPIFLQILHKVQSNPQISLNFFNWVNSNFVEFQLDLKIQCKIIQIVSGSGHIQPVKPVLDSVIEVNPPTHVVHSMVYACKGTNLHSFVFSSIIESYALKSLYVEGLEVYSKIVSYGYFPKVGCLNVMLDVLNNHSEFKLAYCLYGSMFRNGILGDDDTWSVIARILCNNGKFERVVRLLHFGVCNSSIFNLVIDGFSRIGDFGAAFDHVNEMCRRNFEPGFCTFGSILNGACELGDVCVIDTVMCIMMEKRLIPRETLLGYDDVIVKLCDLGNIYAADYMFKRVRGAGVGLKDESFGCLISAFCRAERVDEAIELYRVISKENIVVNKSCYHELADCICKGKPEENVIQLLMRLIKRGFSPSVSNVSKFMMKMVREQSWKEIEDLMNVMLQAKLLPDSGFCRLLVNHYCSSCKVDLALVLHDKVGNSEALWDVTTYNVLLRALFMEKRIDQAIEIFECMKRKNSVNKASFLVMISGLSQEKEMRKAMQVHDDMLKLGLKPSSQKYKSLISVFR